MEVCLNMVHNHPFWTWWGFIWQMIFYISKLSSSTNKISFNTCHNCSINYVYIPNYKKVGTTWKIGTTTKESQLSSIFTLCYIEYTTLAYNLMFHHVNVLYVLISNLKTLDCNILQKRRNSLLFITCIISVTKIF